MNGAICKVLASLYVKKIPLVYCYQMCNVRTDSRKSWRRNRFQNPNPGIENRLKILKMESPDFGKLEQEKVSDQDLDDLESDFMRANEMHKEHEREKKAAADSLAYEITKSKHFKPPKLPNLLMWTEKEQIRNLYQLDSIEWSPEKLSQQFPTTPDIVKKLVKSNWKPRTDAAIARHDRSVLRNWSYLLKGKLNLDPELKRHFLSFSARIKNIPQDPPPSMEQVIIHNKPQGCSEFSDIVKNFSKEKNAEENKPLDVNISNLAPPRLNKNSCDPRGDSFVVPGQSRFSRELLPLKEYKEKVLSQMHEEDNDDELTRKYYDHLEKGINEKKDDESMAAGLQVEEKFVVQANKLQKYKKVEEESNLIPQKWDMYLKAEQYKMKIEIPEKDYDPSAVYKVKDCFYDADGKFLYRVPGLE